MRNAAVSSQALNGIAHGTDSKRVIAAPSGREPPSQEILA